MSEGIAGIRWGRALLAAVIVEILLGVLAVPVMMFSATPASTLDAVVPPSSFIVTLLVVAWLFRSAERPVANGVATGLVSLLIYCVLAFAAYRIAPERADFSQALGLPYLASHLLKIAGGAVGGHWVARRRA